MSPENQGVFQLMKSVTLIQLCHSFTASVYEDAQIGNIPLTIPHFYTILTETLTYT